MKQMSISRSGKSAARRSFVWAAAWLVCGAGGAGAQHLPGTARAASAERAALRACDFQPLGASTFAPPALARIPGGSFAMGNSYSNLSPNEGWVHELPVHVVPVGEFYVGRFELTNEEMARTLQWALTNGLVELDETYFVYTNGAGEVTNVVTNLCGTVRNVEGTAHELVDLDATYCQIAYTNGAFAVAAGKTNFPAIFVTWHGALAFCNYLSDRQGLARAVDFGPTNWSVDVSAEGYRLPTEAEWEKACRGGQPGTHFPWPDDSLQATNTYLYNVDVVKANYWDGRYGALSNNPAHPWFNESIRTTPVGYYDGRQVVTNLTTNFLYLPGTIGADFGQTNDMANGFGLYDMAGNVFEWCWDYHGTDWYANAAASLPDPTGPAAEASYHTQRVVRGGGFTYYIGVGISDPSFLRCSFHTSLPAEFSASYLGFRVARRPTAYETWAETVGLDPLATNGVAEADFDGDGQANGAEFVAQTQPTNPASFFKVASIGPVSNQAWLAYWGASGRVHAVEGATNWTRTNGWQTLLETTNWTTGTTQMCVEAPAEPRALRIKARLAP
ncbi:MAG TPA: SUMF1/EgtB/PvdO family nonheme iron enzyme [Kiritimatiellia bacterium]|nr:SUMF1/EgtB/PvdO family nonheme iron enzyme [Kiritimatiellia bacterium]